LLGSPRFSDPPLLQTARSASLSRVPSLTHIADNSQMTRPMAVTRVPKPIRPKGASSLRVRPDSPDRDERTRAAGWFRYATQPAGLGGVGRFSAGEVGGGSQAGSLGLDVEVGEGPVLVEGGEGVDQEVLHREARVPLVVGRDDVPRGAVG
jgi:hypothetical protein